MYKNIRLFYLIGFIIGIFVFDSYCQLMMDKTLFNEVQQRITAKYGMNIKLEWIYQIDSLELSESSYPRPYQISDLNGTLRNTTIFTAINENNVNCKGLVGVYKNNDIIWDSDTTINCMDDFGNYTGIVIFSISDFNKDGIVDFCFSNSRSGPTPYSSVQRLYVYSWDGNTGWLISDVTNEGISVIESILGTGDFDFVDINGDGIYEITGFWYEDNNYEEIKTISYYWNGIKYGFDLNTPQPQELDFLVQNNIDVSLNVKVEKNPFGFIYNYILYNLPSSKQEINAIYFQSSIDSSIEFYLPHNWYSVNLFDLFGFTDSAYPTIYVKNNFLRVDSVKSFSYLSNKLPSITLTYIQGYNKRPSFDDSLITINSYYNNIVENSKQIRTIGSSNILESLSTLGIIDTIATYCDKSRLFGWIKNQITTEKYLNLLYSTKTYIQQNNNNGARTTLQTVLQQLNIDSTNNLTSEAYALLRYNTEYLLEKIPQANPNLLVNLKNSLGVQIPASNVMYYESATSGWKDAVNNGDGTFTVITTKPTVSIRMFYEYANQTVHNVPAQNNTYTFTTVNTAVELRNSLGNFIDLGTVQYYAGAWRSFGTTANGVAYKELLPVNYSFRMTYEYVPIDKQQDISTNSTVTFSTVLCTVKVTNTNKPLAGASTKYYSTAWRDIGLTNANGIITKELLPKNLSFRASYGNVTKDKQQDIGVNSLVEIQLNIQ